MSPRGTGGVVRAVNGCKVVDGRLVEVNLARAWLVRIQVVEYLRAFMLGRSGWSRFGALILISGAFGMFRRDVLVEVGGLQFLYGDVRVAGFKLKLETVRLNSGELNFFFLCFEAVLKCANLIFLYDDVSSAPCKLCFGRPKTVLHALELYQRL